VPNVPGIAAIFAAVCLIFAPHAAADPAVSARNPAIITASVHSDAEPLITGVDLLLGGRNQ
jgi:hypothetical protein